MSAAASPGHDRRPGDGSEPVPVLVVEVADHRCGLLAGDVDEVHRAVSAVALPEAPTVIEGVINVRGTVVPVLDLRLRLGLPSRPVQVSDRLVVVIAAGRRIALRVDAVLDLLEVAPTSVQPAQEVLPEAAYLAGVVTLADGLVLMHDLHAFLSADEGFTLDRALANVAAAG